MEGFIKVTTFLLKNGASLDTKDKDGKTPEDYVPLNARGVLHQTFE